MDENERIENERIDKEIDAELVLTLFRKVHAYETAQKHNLDVAMRFGGMPLVNRMMIIPESEV